jgi:hypothetical protein
LLIARSPWSYVTDSEHFLRCLLQLGIESQGSLSRIKIIKKINSYSLQNQQNPA